MSDGINHAKKIVIGEAETMAKKLSNGSAGDSAIQGRAIALLVKMITPLYEASFVTKQDCEKMHSKEISKKITKLKVGPIEIEGHLTTALVIGILPPIYMAAFLCGKAKNWW